MYVCYYQAGTRASGAGLFAFRKGRIEMNCNPGPLARGLPKLHARAERCTCSICRAGPSCRGLAACRHPVRGLAEGTQAERRFRDLVRRACLAGMFISAALGSALAGENGTYRSTQHSGIASAVDGLRVVDVIDRSEIELFGMRNLWDLLAGRRGYDSFGLFAPFPSGQAWKPPLPGSDQWQAGSAKGGKQAGGSRGSCRGGFVRTGLMGLGAISSVGLPLARPAVGDISDCG